MKKLKTVATIFLMLMTLGFAGAASAQVFTGFYDFAGTQYADDFTDVRRGSQINGGAPDLGGTLHTALNFTGQAGPAGDTWLTKWTKGGALQHFNGRCGTGVRANILIHPFNNRKGAGLVALLNDANPGDKGLAVIVYDNGNTDVFQLATIDPFTGKLVPVPHPFNNFPLLARIKEDAWYAVLMEVTVDLAFEGHSLLVQAAVVSLQDPTDPNSEFDHVLGGMWLRTPLEALGLQPQGQVGIMASAISAVVDSSVTNWAAEQGFEGPCSE